MVQRFEFEFNRSTNAKQSMPYKYDICNYLCGQYSVYVYVLKRAGVEKHALGVMR